MIAVGLTVDLEIPAEAGLAGRYFLKTAYVEAVTRAGGLPILLPHLETPEAVEACLDRLEALVVTGGAFDVPPALYGEAPRPGLGRLVEARTASEAALTRAALARGLPVLGVCGGMQLLNVLRGGSLYQDLRQEVPGARDHEQRHDRRRPDHEAVLLPGSRLAGIAAAPALQVNSTHHQAVKTLGEGLVASATAPDGIVEAVEDPSSPFVLGVQWHPELLTDDPAQQAIYDALVAAARTPRGTHG